MLYIKFEHEAGFVDFGIYKNKAQMVEFEKLTFPDLEINKNQTIAEICKELSSKYKAVEALSNREEFIKARGF